MTRTASVRMSHKKKSRGLRAPVQLKPVQLGYSSLPLPIKRAIRRAPQSHYPSPATLVVKALARDGLPQADQLRSSLGENLLDHLGGGRLDLLSHLLGSDRGGNALCLSHTLTYSFPAFSFFRQIATYTLSMAPTITLRMIHMYYFCQKFLTKIVGPALYSPRIREVVFLEKPVGRVGKGNPPR